MLYYSANTETALNSCSVLFSCRPMFGFPIFVETLWKLIVETLRWLICSNWISLLHAEFPRACPNFNRKQRQKIAMTFESLWEYLLIWISAMFYLITAYESLLNNFLLNGAFRYQAVVPEVLLRFLQSLHRNQLNCCDNSKLT